MEYRYYPLSADRLEPIEEMAQGIASAGSERAIFRSLFLFAARTTPATAIFVSLYAPQTGLRRCVYAAEVITDEEGNDTLEEDEDVSIYPQLPLNDSPPSRAILTGEVINSPDLVAALAGLPRMASGSDAGENLPKSALTVPLGTESRTVGAFQAQSLSPRAFNDSHIPPLRVAAKLAALAVENLDLIERQRAQHEGTLRALGLALEYRDFETKGHTDRVVKLSIALGEALDLNETDLHALRWGAYLHDIGKVGMPDHLLLKPGPLTEGEFEVVRRHTLMGIDMCRDIPFLAPGTREVIRSHHERWDGNGYPDGLRGDEIPLLARVFSLVDVYDALASERPYKLAWSHEDAVREIEANAGKQFDPDLCQVFLTVLSEFEGSSSTRRDS